MEHSLKEAFARADEIPLSCFPLFHSPFSSLARCWLAFRVYASSASLPWVVEREFKASCGRTKRGRERERDNRERRTKNGETQSGHEHKTEYHWRKGRTIPGISVDQPTPRERDGHATKHRIKRPKFQGGTADSYLLPIDVRLFPTDFQSGRVQSGVVAFKRFISSFDTFEEARGNCSWLTFST